MKIIDRYLIKSFLMPFMFSVLIFSVLVLLGRFFDKMEMFIRFHARVIDIVSFLILALPFWLNLVLPIATMLALLFSLGQLYQRGEYTAFRSAGIPTWRVLLPFGVVGLILSFLSLAGGLTFLPKLNFEARRIYRVNIKKRDVLLYRQDNVVAAGRQHRRFTIGWLDVEAGQMKDVVVDRFGEDLTWAETYSAKLATYENGHWLFKEGTWRSKDLLAPDGIKEEAFTEKWVEIPERPADFAVEDKEPEDMTGNELLRRAERLRSRGASSNREHVALHMRLALPFANVVVIALAIPFALRSGLQGRTQNFSYALGLAFLYWGMISIFQSVGEQGHLPAWLSAWMANFIFMGFAVWKLNRLAKN